MTRGIADTAKIVQTLVFLDGPQLLLLESSLGATMLAVAVHRSDMKHAFFACEVRKKNFEKYAEGKADLHYVFSMASTRQFYFFDWGEIENDTVSLKRAKPAEIGINEYWPEPGFFARSHTHPISGKILSSYEQAFKIDGAWEPRDFSRFYNKIEDLYAFLFVTNRIKKSQTTQEESSYIKQSIGTRFWRGGGSYVGFYDDLSSRVQGFDPLRVARLSYASPGEIVFRGEETVFSDIDLSIQTFEKDHDALSTVYHQLTRILTKEKVRSTTATTFSSDAVNNFVDLQTIKFARAMKIPNAEVLRDLCGNPVVFCKVVLSFYRRVNEINTFRAEGRIQ